MSMFCPNCGSPNEATNRFCWKCGTSLAQGGNTGADGQPLEPATTPVPPAPTIPMPIATVMPPERPATFPAPMPSPQPPPVAAAAPPPAGPPRPRIPMPVLIGGLVAVLGVGAAVGIVLGLTGGGDDPEPSSGSVSTAGPSHDLRTPQPTVVVVDPPTQEPIDPTPRPDATRGPTPTQNTGGGGATQVLGNDYIAVTVPADWTSDVDATSIAAYPRAAGNLFLEMGATEGAISATQMIQSELAWHQANRQDVEVCTDEVDYTFHNGPPGRSIRICYTAKDTSGNAFPAIKFIAVGTQEVSTGTFYYFLSVFARKEAWNDVVKAVNPVLPSIQWKAYESE